MKRISAFIAALALTVAVHAAEKPNVAVILVDDLGAECLRSFGGKSCQTPVLDSLAKGEELHLRDNTLVLITGDNGTGKGIVSATEGKAEVNGGKASTAVKDMKVPLTATWPRTIRPGTCHDLVDMTDFLPTICEAASVAIPASHIIDGHSFLPQLRGEAGKPREWIYSFWAPRVSTQTAKVGKRGAVEQAFDYDYKLYSIGEFYDLRADPEEKHPLNMAELTGAAANTAKKLQATLDHFADARPTDLKLISPGVAAAEAKAGGEEPDMRKERKRKKKDTAL